MTDHRDRDGRGGEAAKHERPLAADHDEADARGDRHRERRQDQRRRALQRVLERERGAEAAAPDIGDEIDRRLADRQQKDSEQRRRDREREQRDDDIFRIGAQLQREVGTARSATRLRSGHEAAPVATGASDIEAFRLLAL